MCIGLLTLSKLEKTNQKKLKKNFDLNLIAKARNVNRN